MAKMTEKEKATAKAERVRLARVEKTRFDALSDADKAKEKAEKRALRPVLTISVSNADGLLISLKTQERSQARGLAIMAGQNNLTSKTTMEVKAREVKFSGI